MFPKLGTPIYIDPHSTVIGDVDVEDHVSIWPHAVLRADPWHIRISAWTNIQDNCVVHAGSGYATKVGEYCVVGHGAILHGCTIGNGCMVGMGSTVMNGAIIGDGCLIGAGTLVTEEKTFPPGSLILGSPGKVVRELSPDEIAGIRGSAKKYWEKALEHMNPSSPAP
jgi:carbonic anhydrase/acetyltransferase-like protein (isoleucine patch superfamily)